jgi:hypothetical protein
VDFKDYCISGDQNKGVIGMTRLKKCKSMFLYCTKILVLIIAGSCSTEAGSSTNRESTDTMKSTQNSSNDTSGSTFTNITRKKLESLRTRWDELKPAQYSYTYTITGFSPERGTYNVVCTDSCRSIDTTTGNVNRNISFDLSIDSLFDLIDNLIGDRRVSYTIQFDKIYGFPESVSIKWGESMGYYISDFRATP